ncbi:hypothetical protein DYB30_008280, partial [Aphanomyces astaci]
NVVINAGEHVANFKDKIKVVTMYRFPAYLMVFSRVHGLTVNQEGQLKYNGATIDMANSSLETFDGSTADLFELSMISECFDADDVPMSKDVHVLVLAQTPHFDV